MRTGRSREVSLQTPRLVVGPIFEMDDLLTDKPPGEVPSRSSSRFYQLIYSNDTTSLKCMSCRSWSCRLAPVDDIGSGRRSYPLWRFQLNLCIAGH